MTLSDSIYRDELESILAAVKERVYHPYVERYVRYPEVNLFQLHFIFLFLKQAGLREELLHQYCVSQVLIQLGLDSHDRIDDRQLTDNRSIKAQQLTILSGDLFSSQYYCYLAERNQVELIKKWACVVKKLNEYKTQFYVESEQMDAAERCQLKHQMRRLIPRSVLSWFGASQLWFNILDYFTHLFIQLEEKVEVHHKLEERVSQLKSALNALEDRTLLAELKLWMDKIEQAVLVIEP